MENERDSLEERRREAARKEYLRVKGLSRKTAAQKAMLLEYEADPRNSRD